MATAKTSKFSAATVEPQVLEGARQYEFQAARPKQMPCRVCGSPGATERSDRLCWVCQHLKISAWREAPSHDSPSD